jgi:hypothetical protein
MRQKRQSLTESPGSPCYNTAFRQIGSIQEFDPGERKKERSPMGTCPKCKLKIRKNGNHVKLGSTWYHKSCPARQSAKS